MEHVLGIHAGQRAWKRIFVPRPLLIKETQHQTHSVNHIYREKRWCWRSTAAGLGFLFLLGYLSSLRDANPFASSAGVQWSSLQDVCDCLKNTLLIDSNILLTSSTKFSRVSLYLFVLVPTLFFNLNRSVPLWCLSLRRAILSPLSLPFAKLNKLHPSTSLVRFSIPPVTLVAFSANALASVHYLHVCDWSFDCLR